MVFQSIVLGFLLLACRQTLAQPTLCQTSGDRIVSQNRAATQDSVELCKAWSRVRPAVREYTKSHTLGVDSVFAWRNDVPELNGSATNSYYLFWMFFKGEPTQLEAFVDRKSGKILVKRPES